MNICLFGATGRVGGVVLENCLKSGHNVHALVRNPEKLSYTHPALRVLHGDALNQQDVHTAVKGCDAVISCLNTGGTDFLSSSMPIIISAMKAHDVHRIIMVSTAGILQARSEPELYRFQSSESRRSTTKDAEEHLKAFLIMEESGLDWTAVCPTYLPVGERIGTYRIGRNILPEHPSSISIYDTGDFTFHQLQSLEYLHCRVGLTY
ncbi:hypothetical protein A8F94_16845 [Bacillus sp. FJAT-27225]|uniref:NAD(P)-dependent oxidoreductase n=1 Tax=Bacillus sp. FJAT-27225 TaxID=1743144 RepID=UPI00080C2D59|nr:NAD(P)H-binding protein [Bacillus sp. FJAT-27225]OCA84371.1 hypothetical protein A8F94_16845 [Bacillus sp. FJAT-27225]